MNWHVLRLGNGCQFGNRAGAFLIWNSDGMFPVNLLMVAVVRRGMLHPMQQTINNAPTPLAPSFAGLLASLTAPAPRTAWNNDDLADDVATLSYEHALRAHARYKTPETDAWEVREETAPAPMPEVSRDDAAAIAKLASRLDEREPAAPAAAKAVEEDSAAFDRNKKCASITIRLSKAECDQLRRRANQAGLTVSAYLRSCTFEAEALRAQVKDVLAELRTAASTEKEIPRVAARRSWFSWLTRLMPRRSLTQYTARA